jgi:hypothetical protein
MAVFMNDSTEELKKTQEIAKKIIESNGAVCSVYFDEFRKLPGADAALRDVAGKQMIEAIKYRAPVYGSIILGMDVANQAKKKYDNGDIKGAVAAFATATAVTATAAVPLIPGVGWIGIAAPLGDGVVETARGLGVDIDKSPIHNAYNTVVGTKHMCERFGASARLAVAPTKPMTTQHIANTARDVLLLTDKPISPDEVEAFNRLVNRVVSTHTGRLHADVTPPLVVSPVSQGGREPRAR